MFIRKIIKYHYITICLSTPKPFGSHYWPPTYLYISINSASILDNYISFHLTSIFINISHIREFTAAFKYHKQPLVLPLKLAINSFWRDRKINYFLLNVNVKSLWCAFNRHYYLFKARSWDQNHDASRDSSIDQTNAKRAFRQEVIK